MYDNGVNQELRTGARPDARGLNQSFAGEVKRSHSAVPHKRTSSNDTTPRAVERAKSALTPGKRVITPGEKNPKQMSRAQFLPSEIFQKSHATKPAPMSAMAINLGMDEEAVRRFQSRAISKGQRASAAN